MRMHVTMYTLYRLGPFVYAFQCLTGKFDNNIDNNIKVSTEQTNFSTHFNLQY